MTTNEIIAGLRKLSGQGSEYRRTVCRLAADKLEDLTVGADAHIGPNQRWIPVTERWPDLIPCGAGTAYSEAVNVLTTGRKVLTAIWNGFDWTCDAEFWDAEGEEITHWTPVLLPLPEPPKGGKA